MSKQSTEETLYKFLKKIYTSGRTPANRDYQHAIDIAIEDMKGESRGVKTAWREHLIRLGLGNMFYRIQADLLREQELKEQAERREAQEAYSEAKLAATISGRKRKTAKGKQVVIPEQTDTARLRAQGQMLAYKKVHLGGTNTKLFMNCTGADLATAINMRRAREEGFKRSADFYAKFNFIGEHETVKEHFTKDGQFDYVELGRMKEHDPVKTQDLDMAVDGDRQLED